MIISYCPICHKAGLRWDDPNGKDQHGRNSATRFNDYYAKSINLPRNKKWCPRCKKWVDYIEKKAK